MDAQAGANTPKWLHHPATRLEQASTDVLEKKMTEQRALGDGHITVNGHRMSIPTTEDVRSQIEDTEDFHPEHEGLYGPMFDAWLALHDAEVKAQALDEAANELEANWVEPVSVEIVRDRAAVTRSTSRH